MAQSILATNEWNQSLGKLINTIGEDDFYSHLAACCQMISGYDSTVIIGFPAHSKPVHIFSNLESSDETPTLGPYFNGAYLLDPFYALYRDNAPDGIYPLRDIAPEEFYETEYYRSYFSTTRLVDETGVLLGICPEFHILISLGLRGAEFKPRASQIHRLQTFFPVLAAACQQHWSRDSQRAGLAGEGDIHGEFAVTLDAAFIRFGRDHLSKRECEIIQLILKGYSSKSIGELLEISVDTVKVHRKRFHAKLGIASQAELFSLFLEAISLVPLGCDQDPLTYYYSSQSQRTDRDSQP